MKTEVIRIKFDGNIRPDIISIEPDEFAVEWEPVGNDWVLNIREDTGLCQCGVVYQALEVSTDGMDDAITVCGNCGKEVE